MVTHRKPEPTGVRSYLYNIGLTPAALAFMAATADVVLGTTLIRAMWDTSSVWGHILYAMGFMYLLASARSLALSIYRRIRMEADDAR